MDIGKILELLQGAIPLYERMKKDQKQMYAFWQDWQEAVEKELDQNKIATLYGIPTAIAMKMPTGFTFNFDPFKPVRLLADDFARAGKFMRYGKLRDLEFAREE